LNNFLKYLIYSSDDTTSVASTLKFDVLEANLYSLAAYALTIILASFTYRYIEIKYYKKI
jgi:hypothetical protein